SSGVSVTIIVPSWCDRIWACRRTQLGESRIVECSLGIKGLLDLAATMARSLFISEAPVLSLLRLQERRCDVERCYLGAVLGSADQTSPKIDGLRMTFEHTPAQRPLRVLLVLHTLFPGAPNVPLDALEYLGNQVQVYTVALDGGSLRERYRH